MACILSLSPTEEYSIIPCESSAVHWRANQTSFPVTPCMLEGSVHVFHEDFLPMGFDFFLCVCFQTVFWKQPVGYVCTALRVACGWSLVCRERHFLLDCTCFSRKTQNEYDEWIGAVQGSWYSNCPTWAAWPRSPSSFLADMEQCKSLHTTSMWAAILLQSPLMHIFKYKIPLAVHMYV